MTCGAFTSVRLPIHPPTYLSKEEKTKKKPVYQPPTHPPSQKHPTDLSSGETEEVLVQGKRKKNEQKDLLSLPKKDEDGNGGVDFPSSTRKVSAPPPPFSSHKGSIHSPTHPSTYRRRIARPLLLLWIEPQQEEAVFPTSSLPRSRPPIAKDG